MVPGRRLRVVTAVVLAVLTGGCGSNDAASPPAKRPATTTPRPRPAQAAPGPAWPRDRVLRRLAGRRVTVTGRAISLDHDTLTCVGLGPRSLVDGKPAWTRFRCVQPTFPPGAVVGPDAILIVATTPAGTLTVVDARLTRY